MDAVKILGSLLSSGVLSNGSGSNVLGNILGSALGGGQQSGMAGMLGSLLGGQQQQGGGMADMLGSLLGGQQQQGGGGIGGMLGSMLSGGQQQQQGGGMADMLGSLLGGGGGSPAGSSMGGLGNLLGGAMSKYAQASNPSGPDLTGNFMPQGYDQNEAEEQATLVLRAMINAAKSDGSIDTAEQQNLVEKLGSLDADEKAFLQREFQAPLDANAFVREVPRGMEQQVYALSLAAIDLDTKQEAQYLHQLAQGFNLSADACNQLHDQVGAPRLYQ